MLNVIEGGYWGGGGGNGFSSSFNETLDNSFGELLTCARVNGTPE